MLGHGIINRQTEYTRRKIQLETGIQRTTEIGTKIKQQDERERESYDRQRVRERKEGEATKILRISLTKRLNMKKDQSFYVAS